MDWTNFFRFTFEGKYVYREIIFFCRQNMFFCIYYQLYQRYRMYFSFHKKCKYYKFYLLNTAVRISTGMHFPFIPFLLCPKAVIVTNSFSPTRSNISLLTISSGLFLNLVISISIFGSMYTFPSIMNAIWFSVCGFE